MSSIASGDFGKVQWQVAQNADSQNPIPPFSLVGVQSADGNGVLTVAQPSQDGQDCYLVGPQPIAGGGRGVVTRDEPFMAAYESGDGTPATGETWGAGAGTYKLRKGNAGFTIQGGAAAGRVLVARTTASASGSIGTGKGAKMLLKTSLPMPAHHGVGVFVTIPFDQQAYGTTGIWSSALHCYTIPVSGYYMVSGWVYWSVGQGLRHINIYGNIGSDFEQFQWAASSVTIGATPASYQSCAGIGYCPAGGTVLMQANNYGQVDDTITQAAFAIHQLPNLG